MSESSVPFDPWEFTAEELQAARDYLLALRRIPVCAAGEEKPMTVTQTHSWQWRWRESGGQACRTPYTIRESEHTMSFQMGPPPDESEWFDYTEGQYKALVAPPPDPDQVVQPPEDEQP